LNLQFIESTRQVSGIAWIDSDASLAAIGMNDRAAEPPTMGTGVADNAAADGY
jgi:hypothetical protein